MTDRSDVELRFSFAEAFDATASERAALAEKALVPINLDIPTTVASVFGCRSQLRGLRDSIIQSLPQWDIGHLDALDRHAAALADAHVRYLAASRPTPAVRALGKRAKALRASLLMDARALTTRRLVDPGQLEVLHGGSGYLRVASDLGILANILQTRWAEIGSRTAVTAEELREAESLAYRLIEAFAIRDHRPAVEKAASDRHRAFTLLVRTHDEIRRAVSYVRWKEGDAEAFIPSLWRGRGKRPTKLGALAIPPDATSSRLRVAIDDAAESAVSDEESGLTHTALARLKFR